MTDLTHAQKTNIGFAWVLEQCRPCSAWGRQLLAAVTPYAPETRHALQNELQNVEKTLAARPGLDAEYTRLEHVFAQIKDIRASIRRCGSGVLSEVELFEVKRYLLQLAEMTPLFERVNAAAVYTGIALAPTAGALALLDPEKTGVASFHISSRWSEKLAALRAEKKAIELELRAAPGAAASEALAGRRRELAAAEQEEEALVRERLSGELGPWAETLLANADAIARLDVVIQKARLAAKHGATLPVLGAGEAALRGMWNPMVAEGLEEHGEAFTPVSITLEPGATVITGANMGGKSVTLKTLALNLYLAQCGFFVFAESCETPLFSAFHMVSEDLEDTARGLSSFGGEIVRLQEIIATLGAGRALVLLDEFARGTNPREGAAIAQSVCAWLNRRADFSVLTTHFDHVAECAGAHYEVAGLKNADIGALAAQLAAAPTGRRVALIAAAMNYGLVPVRAAAQMPRDALNICRLLGLSDEIITDIERKLLTFASAEE